MIFNSKRHESLIQQPWSKDKVEAVLHQIYYFIIEGFDPDNFWKAHPDDEAKNACNKALYYGAS